MATLTINPAQTLANIVGAEHVALAGEVLLAAPANTQQISVVLRFANEHGLIVIPAGGCTKHGWGNAVQPAILLSLARMNAIREHAWQDMTCTVEAGCTWATIQQAVAQHGQMIALDPLWPERATIGGIVATNDSGALRLKYGGLRDLIIGMTIVLADGTIAKTGGKVVKNVAGYDLHKLMTGGFGTLGVIAEVNFRLHPVEQHARTWTIAAPNATALDAPLRALMDSQMAPSCMQLRSSGAGFELDVRIASLPECLSAHVPTIEKICGKLGQQHSLNESDEEVWLARQRLFDTDNIVLKASMLPSEIASITAKLHVWLPGIETVTQATGTMTIALNAAPDEALESIERLRNELEPMGGSVVVLQIPDEFRSHLDIWGTSPDTLPLMREIKRRFDPHRILNPGRLVGGI